MKNFVFFPAKELGPTSCLFPLNFYPFFSFDATFSKFEEAKMSKDVNGTMPNEKKRRNILVVKARRRTASRQKQKIPVKIYFPGGGVFY